MQFDASIQNGIVMYLNGSTYASGYSVSEDEYLFSSRSSISIAELEKRNVKEFFDRAEDSLITNGMPTQCFDCNACKKSEVSAYKDERVGTRHYRQLMQCEKRGCDSAREAFVKNFDKVTKRGGKRIELYVEINEPEPISMPTLGGMTPYLTRPLTLEDRISITAKTLPSTNEDFSAFDMDPTLLNRVKDRMQKSMTANRVKEEKELEEIGELFDLGLIAPKDQPANYGEVAW